MKLTVQSAIADFGAKTKANLSNPGAHGELLNVLNVLGCLIDLEPAQAALLDKICAGPTLSADELRAAGAFELPAEAKSIAKPSDHLEFFT